MKSKFWEEAITNAVYLLNRVPTSVLKFQTPLDKLASFVTIPSHLKLPPRVFGCVVFVHLQKHLRTKLDPYAIKCVFVGYHPFQKGYRCYHPQSHKFYVTMDVTFSEHEMFYSSDVSNSLLQGESVIEELNWKDLFPTNSEINMTANETSLSTHPPVSSSRIDDIQVMEPVQEFDIPVSEEIDTPAIEAPSLSSSTVPTSNCPPAGAAVPEVSIYCSINTDDTCELTDTDRYQLPQRSNRGVPSDRFSPKPIKKVKYPIAN